MTSLQSALPDRSDFQPNDSTNNGACRGYELGLNNGMLYKGRDIGGESIFKHCIIFCIHNENEYSDKLFPISNFGERLLHLSFSKTKFYCQHNPVLIYLLSVSSINSSRTLAVGKSLFASQISYAFL